MVVHIRVFFAQTDKGKIRTFKKGIYTILFA